MDLTRHDRRHELGSYLGISLAWAMAGLLVGACLLIIGYLFSQGHNAVSWEFLTTDPTASIGDNQAGGVRIPLAGTLVLVLGSLLIAVPLAIASALYLAEYMNEEWAITRIIRIGIEVLAGVPSVVFGMFGLAVFTIPALAFFSSAGADNASAAFGRSFFVASFIMGIHVLPFIVKAAEEAIRAIPDSYRLGAAALGMTKWRAIRKVILPAAAPGIATGVVLGVGLVAGDTAIVTLTLGASMTMGADAWWQLDNLLTVLRGTGSTLTTYTYFNSPAGEGNSPELAFGAALLLMGVVVLVNLAATLIARFQTRAGRA